MSFVSQWNYNWDQKGVAHPRWSFFTVSYPRPKYGKVEARCELALEEAAEGGKFFVIEKLNRLPRGIEFTEANENTLRPLFMPQTGGPVPTEMLQLIAGMIGQGVITYGAAQLILFSLLHGAALEQEEVDATAPPPQDPPPEDPPQEP
jgi:hypothetical protein